MIIGRFIDRELVSLHAFRQVGLTYRAFHQSQELGLCLFCSSAFSNNAAPYIYLRAQDTVNESLD